MSTTETMINVRVRPGRHYNDESIIPRRTRGPGEVIQVTQRVLDECRSILVECETEEEAALASVFADRGIHAPGLPVPARAQARKAGRPRKPSPEPAK